MADIFVNESDEIKVTVAVGTGKNGEIFADITEKDLMETYGEDLDESAIETFEVVFRQPTFKDSISFGRSTFSTDEDQALSINPLASRYIKVIKLIKSWTFKDKDGNAVEPNEKNISRLHPSVSLVIGQALDAQTPTL